MHKLLVTELALAIKAPANDLAIRVPFHQNSGALLSQRMLMHEEDSFGATALVVTESTREGLLAGGADTRHDGKEDECCGSGGC